MQKWYSLTVLNTSGNNDKYYLKVGRASDLKSTKERVLYRVLEIIPGIISWATIVACFVFSWLAPAVTAIFIILFDLYWLLKTVYLSLHLRVGYKRMTQNLKVDWLAKVKKIDDWERLHHLVVFPMYQESIEVVRPAFQALVNNTYPLDKMIVVLTYEEKGEDGAEIAQKMSEEFGGKFFKFISTCHPSGLEGEMAGKGSNESWGVKVAKREVLDQLNVKQKNIIVSVFDVDTVIHPKYFSRLSYEYLIHPNPTHASFQPIPLFINNIWEAPALARVIAFSSTFWHTIQQERPEKHVTFSSHSMSFKALNDIGFWQKNIVSEDSRVFWQNYLYYSGDYEVVSLHMPVSMDANVASTFTKTMVNQYKQMRRWAWGVENLPYMFFGFWKDKKISWGKKIHWSIFQFEGFWSWSTNALIIFLLGWLPILLGGDKFNETVLSYNLPFITRSIMTLAMVGVITSAFLSITLLPSRPRIYGKHRWIMMVLQWAFLPISIVFFGSIPSLDAQTRLILGKYMGFWPTEKARRPKA